MTTSDNLRILLVSLSRNDPFGGASRVFHLLHDGLTRRGHVVRLLHREDLGEVDRWGKLPARIALPQLASRALAKHLPAHFDVVMSASGMLGPLFRQMGPGRAKRVHHLLGASFFDHQATLQEASRGHESLSLPYRLATGQLPLRWDRAAAEVADLITVNCQRDLDLVIDQGIPEERCRWIPLPVHPAIQTSRSASDTAPKRQPRSAIWFGSWSDRKGIAYLPRAWRDVLAEYPDARLTVGGTGMDEAAIHARFTGMDVSGIRVLGRISIAEQVAEFERHSVFLFPSLSEGFGFALLEAMACGLACITTATGMGGDLAEHGRNALVIPQASSIHLAQAVRRLFSDDGLRRQIADGGRDTADHCTLDRMMDAYEAAFYAP